VTATGPSPSGDQTACTAVARFLGAIERRLTSSVALVGEVEQVQIMRRELPKARAGDLAAVRLLAEAAEGFLSAEGAGLVPRRSQRSVEAQRAEDAHEEDPHAPGTQEPGRGTRRVDGANPI
jgi:hypothetical protein